ncbi:hypothetical protein OQA88_460 [Cercophora sp. LCS_1]
METTANADLPPIKGGKEYDDLIEKIKEQYVDQQMDFWMTKSKYIGGPPVAELYNAGIKHHTILPHPNGGSLLIPCDEAFNQHPQELVDYAAHVEELVDNELKEIYFVFHFQKPAHDLSFRDKIRALSQYRLAHVDLEDDGERIMFKFVVGVVNTAGDINQVNRSLAWGSPVEEIQEQLSLPIDPVFHPFEMVPRQLFDLGSIWQPEGAAQQAEALRDKVLGWDEWEDNTKPAEWQYILCNDPLIDVKTTTLQWIPITGKNDLIKMRADSKETGLWPLLVRPWQLRYQDLCHSIQALKASQFSTVFGDAEPNEDDKNPNDNTELSDSAQFLHSYHLLNNGSFAFEDSPDILHTLERRPEEIGTGWFVDASGISWLAGASDTSTLCPPEPSTDGVVSGNEASGLSGEDQAEEERGEPN